MNRRKEGARYERAAEEYLKELGYRIVARNFRSRYAEIDLVAQDGKYLVFAEVKQRSTRAFGTGAEAVGTKKQERICRAAHVYLMKSHISPLTPVRFDVVSIDSGRIRVLKDAFSWRGASM